MTPIENAKKIPVPPDYIPPVQQSVCYFPFHHQQELVPNKKLVFSLFKNRLEQLIKYTSLSKSIAYKPWSAKPITILFLSIIAAH